MPTKPTATSRSRCSPKSSAAGSKALCRHDRVQRRLVAMRDLASAELLGGGFELRLDDDIDTPIALAALLRVVVRDRLRLAVADGADPKRRHLQLVREECADGFGAPAREREIVLVTTVGVRVAFDRHLRAREHVGRLLELL